MEFSDVFTEEHKIVRRGLRVLELMAKQVEQTGSIDRHDANALLLFLHYFVDACHQGKEEAILFPELRAAAKPVSGVDPTVLLNEHHEDRSLIEETQLALFTENHSEFVATARRLIHLLQEHAAGEEEFLLPWAERTLSARQAEDIAVKLHEYDERFGVAQRRLLTEMLGRLEEKYVPRAA